MPKLTSKCKTKEFKKAEIPVTWKDNSKALEWRHYSHKQTGIAEDFKLSNSGGNNGVPKTPLWKLFTQIPSMSLWTGLCGLCFMVQIICILLLCMYFVHLVIQTPLITINSTGKASPFPTFLLHWWWWPAGDPRTSHQSVGDTITLEETICWHTQRGFWWRV